MTRPKPKPKEPTHEIINNLVSRYVAGENLSKMLQNDRNLPGWATFNSWLSKAEQEGADPIYRELASRYARAKVARTEVEFARVADIEQRMTLPRKIANPDFRPDEKQGQDNPRYIENPDFIDPQTGRVLIDSIKWRLSKMRPELYGDRTAVDMTANVKHSTPRDEAPEWLQNMLTLEEGKKAAKGSSKAKPSSDGSTETH